jgi:hypothetical protein
MQRKRQHRVLLAVLTMAGVCGLQDAQAWWSQFQRPYNSESCTAYGGLFAIQGEAFNDAGIITKITLLHGTNKLGDAAILYREGTQQKECTWTFPWSNVVIGSAVTLRAVAYGGGGSGASTSAVTATFSMASNFCPAALTTRAHAEINTASRRIDMVYVDTNNDQFWTARPTAMPLHGTVSNVAGSTALYYTPSNGFSGLDSFSYTISDGVTNSVPATCQVMVHTPSNPAGAWVMLMVNSNLLNSVASNAIWRLKGDLEAEGYTAAITPWPASGTTFTNVWRCLRDAYTNTEHFMVGAVLIGDIPKPRAWWAGGSGKMVDNELLYWNMRDLQAGSTVTDRHIWVSRISVYSTTYGSETTLVMRALDANHAYRRGESRLPFTAYRYRIPQKSDPGVEGGNYLSLRWPAVEKRGDVSGTNLRFLPSRTDLGSIDGADCMVKGGDLFEQVSHGNSSGYMSRDGGTSGAWLTKDLLHRNLVQTRVCVMGSCYAGTYGGIGNEHLFTRGGGCVLVTGATEESWDSNISTSSNFVGLLTAGYSWGDALVQGLVLGNSQYGAFHGDLSLRPMASVYSNAMPVISSFTASSSSTSAGLAVNFSVAATDPDGVISNIEWFLTGFDGGRANPTFSGTATNVAYVYGTPGTYTARVEVVDNYQARTWREMTVNVTTAIPYTVTVTLAGNGTSSFGALSPATRRVAPGGSTQIVFTAGAWCRLESLSTNAVAVPGAAGARVYTQALVNVAGNVSNAAVFALATPVQTGYTNVPTAWLSHWPEQALVSDPAFDIPTKYRLGLDPTTTNTVALAIESVSVAGDQAVIVIKRTVTGGLSPDGMHGELLLQGTDRLDAPFTNIEASVITGATVFDAGNRRAYTNSLGTSGQFLKGLLR